MRALFLIPAAFLAVAAANPPVTPPIPRINPRTQPVETPAAPSSDTTGEDAAPEDPPPEKPDEAALAACEKELSVLGVVFKREDAIDGPGECGLPATYSIAQLAPGVSLGPETQLTCETALQAARWVRGVVIPAARELGDDTRLTGIRHASTYVCRTRNGQPDAKTSEHAFGRAIDVKTFEFANHKPLSVKPRVRTGRIEEGFQRAVHGGACLYFTTVLGPGADSFHDDHIHLDVAKRSHGFRLCE